MAICKDCLHFDVCSPYTAPNESYPEVEGGCRCFKDKQKFIELPCKVGDTVYFLDVRSLTIRKLEVATILISSPKAILLHLTDGNLHGAYDFGISLFYTKEEAEKALAERWKKRRALKNGDPIPATDSGKV